MLDEKNELRNRNLHISGVLNNQKPKVDIRNGKVDIKTENVDIQQPNIDIENSKPKADIEKLSLVKECCFSSKTKSHIYKLYDDFGYEKFFGRAEVVELIGIKNSSASKFIKKMLESEIIEPVSGHGKGKYKFR